MDNTSSNKHKDRLFCRLFGDEQNKQNSLSLYNALNNSNYTNTDELEVTTIEDAVYIKMKNDVSFLVDSILSLWEQPNTFNPNMPIRGLIYYGNLYNNYIDERGLNIHGSKLVKLPTPQYTVLYNGKTNKKPVLKLKLSDAFMQKDANKEFDWTATVLNLNPGKNDELLAKCKILSDYMAFIHKINAYKGKTATIKEAVELAIEECIASDVLAEFLKMQKNEVLSNCLAEFNEEVYRRDLIEEGREEGRKEGRKEGREEGREEGRTEGREEERAFLVQKLYLKELSVETIAELLEMTEDEVNEILEKA